MPLVTANNAAYASEGAGRDGDIMYRGGSACQDVKASREVLSQRADRELNRDALRPAKTIRAIVCPAGGPRALSHGSARLPDEPRVHLPKNRRFIIYSLCASRMTRFRHDR